MRQEIAGGYLWSPVTEANGARSRFYDNMRTAAPGDIVLSYADGKVGRIGSVVDYAISAPKPMEFGSTGAYWNNIGRLLPVQWFDAALAVRPKILLDRLAPLLPESHSPIQVGTGNGNQKAYLAEVSHAVADLICGAARLRLTDFMAVTPDRTSADFTSALDDHAEQEIFQDNSLNQTTREQLIRARRGQGTFRNSVLAVEPLCRVTGITAPYLLIASHIKPWRACSTADERLDGFNGLMLAPHADFLFDRGLISFDDNGHILFSSQLTEMEASKLGLHSETRPPPKPFHGRSLAYFVHHRTNTYIP